MFTIAMLKIPNVTYDIVGRVSGGNGFMLNPPKPNSIFILYDVIYYTQIIVTHVVPFCPPPILQTQEGSIFAYLFPNQNSGLISGQLIIL